LLCPICRRDRKDGSQLCGDLHDTLRAAAGGHRQSEPGERLADGTRLMLEPNAKANTRRAWQRSVEGEDNLSRNAGFVGAGVEAASARRWCMAGKNLGKERVYCRA